MTKVREMSIGNDSDSKRTMTIGEVARRAEARRERRATEDREPYALAGTDVVLNGRAELERARIIADRLAAPSIAKRIAATAAAATSLMDRIDRLRSVLDHGDIDKELRALLERIEAGTNLLQERISSMTTAAVLSVRPRISEIL